MGCLIAAFIQRSADCRYRGKGLRSWLVLLQSTNRDERLQADATDDGSAPLPGDGDLLHCTGAEREPQPAGKQPRPR